MKIREGILVWKILMQFFGNYSFYYQANSKYTKRNLVQLRLYQKLTKLKLD